MESAKPIFICWDLETAGCDGVSIHDDRNRVLQIAAQTIDGKQLFEQKVNPGMKIPIPSSKIHSICAADVENAPTLDTVLPAFSQWCARVCNGRPLVLVAHNGIAFDWPVLAREAKRTGSPLPVVAAHADTLLDARKAWPTHDCFQLATLYAKLSGVPLENAHNAAVDVRACAYILKRLEHDNAVSIVPHSVVCSGTVPSNETLILTIKWIGPVTATKIVTMLNESDYVFDRLGNVVTVGDLRSHFSGWGIAAIEQTLRGRIGLSEDRRALPLLAAIINAPQAHVASKMPFITYDFGPFDKFFTNTMRRRLCDAGIRTSCALYQDLLYRHDTTERLVIWLKTIGLTNTKGFQQQWMRFMQKFKR